MFLLFCALDDNRVLLWGCDGLDLILVVNDALSDCKLQFQYNGSR